VTTGIIGDAFNVSLSFEGRVIEQLLDCFSLEVNNGTELSLDLFPAYSQTFRHFLSCSKRMFSFASFRCLIPDLDERMVRELGLDCRRSPFDSSGSFG